jgi:hypothetical protein
MKQTIRVTWKILLVILPGLILWCIYWVSVFINYRNEEEETSSSLTLHQIGFLVPIFAAVVNPLIFTLLTPEFRNHLLKFICRRKETNRITNTVRPTEEGAATISVV